MDFEQFKQWFFAPQSEATWITQIFITVLLTLLLNFVWRKVHQRVAVGLKRSKTLWDDAVWEALRPPVGWSIWILGFSVAAAIIRVDMATPWLDWISPTRDVAMVGIVAWFGLRVIAGIEAHLLQNSATLTPEHESRLDATTVHALSKLIRASVVITALLTILQTLDIEITGVLAFGGIGGLAVGLAAKDLLANFFGGLAIYMDRPFQVGDWIRSPDKNIEGTVEYIGWRQTRILTFDKRPLYVPNASFSSISVENPSRMQNRRIYETIGLRYADSGRVAAIIDQVREYLNQHQDIDQTQTLIVNFNSFAPSSLDFFIYTFTRTKDWVEYQAIKQNILLDILNIIHAAGADVAFPTTSVYLERQNEEPN